MAHHKSCLKRIRQNEKRRLHNRPKLQKMLDKLAKQNIIHWKKAANLKSNTAKMIAKLA